MSIAAIKTIVVHGATGQQDESASLSKHARMPDSAATRGSVVRALAAARSYAVRAAVRDLSAAKAQALAVLPTVQLVKVDLGDAQTLAAAYSGADAVFACTSPDLAGGGREVADGKAIADAAKAAGVKLLIWSALPSIKELSHGEFVVRPFDDKAVVTAYIKSLGIPATMMYLGAFMENYVNFPGQATYDTVEQAIVLQCGSLHPGKKHTYLRVRQDVGAAAAIILAHADEFSGMSIRIAHVEHTIEEQAQIVEKISGKRCRAVQGPKTPFQDLNNMHKFFNEREGWLPQELSSANSLLEKYGFKPASFEGFVQEELLPYLKL